MKMDAALANDRGRREEQIHQHGLAAADVAENVETLDRLRLARSEQPAQGGRLMGETTLGASLFAMRQPVDDSLLAAVALDLPSRNSRTILQYGVGRQEQGRTKS